MQPFVDEIHGDPLAVCGFQPNLRCEARGAERVHNRPLYRHHAREELDALARERGVEGEADARGRESTGVPDLVLVCRERVGRGRGGGPPPCGVG